MRSIVRLAVAALLALASVPAWAAGGPSGSGTLSPGDQARWVHGSTVQGHQQAEQAQSKAAAKESGGEDEGGGSGEPEIIRAGNERGESQVFVEGTWTAP